MSDAGVLEGDRCLLKVEALPTVGHDLPAGAETEVFDAAGCYVLPGLIDAHCHIGILKQQWAPWVLTETKHRTPLRLNCGPLMA